MLNLTRIVGRYIVLYINSWQNWLSGSHYEIHILFTLLVGKFISISTSAWLPFLHIHIIAMYLLQNFMLKLNFILCWTSYTSESVESRSRKKQKMKTMYQRDESHFFFHNTVLYSLFVLLFFYLPPSCHNISKWIEKKAENPAGVGALFVLSH